MLYVIRHGRTDWNDRRQLQGTTDISLNEEGKRQAREAAQKYKDVHFDICYCSPLSRARETAELVLAGRDVPIVFDDRLKELSFGDFEGVEYDYYRPDCPIREFFVAPDHYKAPESAESFEHLFARVEEFLKEVAYPELDKGKDVLIAGHGALNSAMFCVVKNIPLKDFWSTGIPNCGLLQLI